MTKPAGLHDSNNARWIRLPKGTVGVGVFCLSLAMLLPALSTPLSEFSVRDRFARAVWQSALSTAEKPCAADEARVTVAKLSGINANVGMNVGPNEVEARQAFFRESGKEARPGQEVIVKTEDGRRFALTIARRMPLTDQAVQRSEALSVVPVGRERTLILNWGNWQYEIEAEPLEAEPQLAVQQNL